MRPLACTSLRLIYDCLPTAPLLGRADAHEWSGMSRVALCCLRTCMEVEEEEEEEETAARHCPSRCMQNLNAFGW